MDNKQITSVIVSFGYSHLLANCLDSILAQTRKPDKIIIVDDAANDGCDKIAEKYSIPCIVRPKNLGVVKNFNDILFNLVETHYVFFTGADNYWRPDALEKMASEDADIISTDWYTCGSGVNGEKLKDDPRYYYKDGYYVRKFPTYGSDEINKEKIRRKNFIHGSSLYNVEFARKVGGYEAVKPNSKGKRLCEDWGLWKKMLRNGAKLKHISEPLLYYRKHKDNWGGLY